MPRRRRVKEKPLILPVLPLRDVVVYPHLVVPLLIGRQQSINALEMAMAQGKSIFLVAQKQVNEDFPDAAALFGVGTVSTIVQLLKLPDGTVKAVIEGDFRAKVIEYISREDYVEASVHRLTEDEGELGEESEESLFILMRTLNNRLGEYAKLSTRIQPEIISSLSSIESPGRFADILSMNLSTKLEDKQKILEETKVEKRLKSVMLMLESEIDLLQVEKKIQERVRSQMEKTQLKFYLDEKAKAIQKELAELEPSSLGKNELEVIKAKIEKSHMSKEAKDKALSEWEKLRFMPVMSAEATVVRVYLDWLIKLPWSKKTQLNKNLKKATEILDADHYGLEEIKERIIEYIAVQCRAGLVRGPILCLVGPPGVGKTSLGRSIARATHRNFVRFSLGGVRDEAEIRGHRRTYIGALPGKIVQKIVKAKCANPLFLFDEIDKMGKDFRGDPASALLEVLDPEQNVSFNDHYLEVDFDLSKIMFVATANSLDIPPALLDRMEVIRLPGYTEFEKMKIATRYLIPKQMKMAGLKEGELRITDGAVSDIIHYYTREAGVRDLEREIAKVCRKLAKELVLKSAKPKAGAKTSKPKTVRLINCRNLGKYLGVRRYKYGVAADEHRVGQVCGLAWTQVGGELLTIEAVVTQGKGNAVYTGRLGDIMQESIKAAMTVVRSRAELLGLEPDFYQNYDIHVHVPEGATPKDGPSAGIGMCTALVSAFTQIPVRSTIAMTGEITLRGEVLPIGGLKEKLLAAARGGIKQVLIPEDNKKNLAEIPSEITRTLDIRAVRWIDDVLKLALIKLPNPAQAVD